MACSFVQVNSSSYQAFDSPTYPHLATLGVQIEWNQRYLLNVEGVYRCPILLQKLMRELISITGHSCNAEIYSSLLGSIHILIDATGQGSS